VRLTLNIRDFLHLRFLKKWSSQKTYNRYVKMGLDGDHRFNNHGYVALTESEKTEMTLPIAYLGDSFNLFNTQLYHCVAAPVDLTNKHVLEVGCGRGGGSSYLQEKLRASKVVGLDLAKKNIEVCKKHSNQYLSYIVGDAEDLPFNDSTFDIVVNIESSHNYPNIELFYKEVRRVLKNNGHFLYADIFPSELAKCMALKLYSQRLCIVSERDITANVVEALRLKTSGREKLFRKKVSDETEYKTLANFAALAGTPQFNQLKGRQLVYKCYVIKAATN